MDKNTIWEKKYDKLNLVELYTKKYENGSISYAPIRGWVSVCVYLDYIIATTFDTLNKETEKCTKGIYLFDKENGDLLYSKKMDQIVSIQSFDNGASNFISYELPYPAFGTN